jgi:hypothetical protein
MSDAAAEHIQGTTDFERFSMRFFIRLAKRVVVHNPPVFEAEHSLKGVLCVLKESIMIALEIQFDKLGL